MKSIGEQIRQEGIDEGIKIGRTQGIEIGQQKERNKNILNLKNNLIRQSGGTLSDKEALEQAELLLS